MEVEYRAMRALMKLRSSIGLRWIRSQKLRGKVGIKDETVRHNVNERIGIDEHQRYCRTSAA